MIIKTKLPLSISILLACFASAMGQSSVWNLPESPDDTSIVREWTGGKYLVYSKKLPSNKITLHDNYSPTAISIPIPSNVHINDFRIVGDTVFAGGYMLNVSSKYGLIACFDINDMLAGSGTFHWMTFFQNTMSNDCCDVNYTDLVTEVKRIAPFNDGNGTCIAYIADNDIRSGSNVIYKRVGYGDVAFWFGTETHCDNMELIPGFSSSPGIKIHSRHHCPTKPLSVSGPLSFTTIEEEAVLQCTTEE